MLRSLRCRRLWQVFLLSFVMFFVGDAMGQAGSPAASAPVAAELASNTATSAVEMDLGGAGIFARAWRGGVVVFLVLLILIIMSVLTWAISVAKFLHLRRVAKTSESFLKSFWDSRSLNELNGRLNDHPYSPLKEVFRQGYAELVKASQLREQSQSQSVAVHAAVENMTRSLAKGKATERRRMESYLSVLAISASAAPFIGLFGTVWGIMGAFEGIARTGSASLAAVAPGISEALIATAFGLAAAIPAVIGYNIANGRIRSLLVTIDGFAADFLNIVERYLVTERSPAKGQSASVSTQVTDRI
jgi:biopolymer transport protein TolQ